MRDRILKIARSVLGNDASFETSMENAPSWDSLKTLQIVMGLDEEGVSIPFEKIAEIRSISDIIEIAEEQGPDES
ncbi:MAG: acyl carrier protein [Synergistaceae bacterium]|jgi:acyl carrier protein|nr:acyl carrier protein [Synergistaceae bacterium]